MTRKLLSWPQRFLRDRSGNVAIITALCALPMFGLLGFAIDYGVALSDKSKLDAAADAATMVAITTAQNVIKGGGSVATALSEADSQAQKAFTANAGSVAFATVPTLSLPITSKNGQTITASISYSTQAQTNFSRLIGISDVAVRGTSVSSLALTTYMNIYVLVDISQSMGIAANPAQMQLLYNRVVASGNGSDGEVGCVFGCHVKAPGQSVTNEDLAHNITPSILLRIDSAVTAIQAIITQAQKTSGSVGNIQIGLYTMSDDPVSGHLLNQVSAPSANYANLTALAATIDLGGNVSGGDGDSDMTDSLTQFYNNYLSSAASGDGTSPSSPLNYVYIITDGLADTPGSSCLYGHCVSSFNPAPCGPLQGKATVDVIYTTYLPLFAGNVTPAGSAPYPASAYESNYYQLVYPVAVNHANNQDIIAQNLQACATPAKTYPTYYEASDDTTLIADLTQLFASTTQIARLTH